jgi:hypothetical protein
LDTAATISLADLLRSHAGDYGRTTYISVPHSAVEAAIEGRKLNRDTPALYAKAYQEATDQLIGEAWREMRKLVGDGSGFGVLLQMRNQLGRRLRDVQERATREKDIGHVYQRFLEEVRSELALLGGHAVLRKSLLEVPPQRSGERADEDKPWRELRMVTSSDPDEPAPSPLPVSSYVLARFSEKVIDDSSGVIIGYEAAHRKSTNLDFRDAAPTSIGFGVDWTWREVWDFLSARHAHRLKTQKHVRGYVEVLQFRTSILEEAIRQVEVFSALPQSAPEAPPVRHPERGAFSRIVYSEQDRVALLEHVSHLYAEGYITGPALARQLTIWCTEGDGARIHFRDYKPNFTAKTILRAVGELGLRTPRG